jgi:stage V sporulation protein AD
MATHFGLLDFKIPIFGIYGACSNCGEGLSLAAMCTAAGYCDYAAAVTSSHFASAEKQFRFPLQYAALRNLSATWTVTGSGAFVVGRKPVSGSKSGTGATVGHGGRSCMGSMVDAAITGITTGQIVDYGIKDAANMGACMAPAAMQCIRQNFLDFGRTASDYDRIITGDLGTVGREILLDLMDKEGYDISANHEDCGMIIYDGESQGTGAGGSGCGCSAVTLSAYYLPKIRSGELKRILFVPTGALLSPVSSNEGKSIPGIAHAIVIEGE